VTLKEGWGGKTKSELPSQASELRRATQRAGTGKVGKRAGEQAAGTAAWPLAWISAADVDRLGKAASRRALRIVGGVHTKLIMHAPHPKGVVTVIQQQWF